MDKRFDESLDDERIETLDGIDMSDDTLESANAAGDNLKGAYMKDCACDECNRCQIF